MLRKNILSLLFIILAIGISNCSKKGEKPQPPAVVVPPDDNNPPDDTDPDNSPDPPNNYPVVVTVDCSKPQGNVMRIEQANVHSTTSPQPSEKTKQWIQNLNHTVLRTWIQLRYVYNKGNINYNYKYTGSNVPLETSLAYYSQCADSLLIALSAYNSSEAWPLPQGTAFKDFIRETLVYYKTKYPKIKYIQVGNEPDHAGETMDTYYPIYQHYYRAVNEANTKLNLSTGQRMLISNGPITGNVPKMLAYANTFFKKYAEDPDPGKKLDFFSFHCYGETNRPQELATAKSQINQALASNGLPKIPAFVTEYGLVGGSDLPTDMTLEETVLMQAPGQLTKAFYLYESGIDKVFNWNIHHGSIDFKSQVKDIQNAYAYPYGNALLLCREVSDRKTRIAANSTKINSLGLGTHVLASMGNNKGIAVLVWNFNWRETTFNQEFNVEIKNIPKSLFPGKITRKIYLIDSKNNNYFNNKSQTTLKVSRENSLDYSATLKVPLQLEKSSVALILLTP